jgi:hypothetical protein
MNTLEIKGSLFDLLWSVDDPQTLIKVREVVLELLGKAQKEEADWWEELTPQQQSRLDKAMADAKAGKNIISHEAAMAQLDAQLRQY